MAKKNYKRILGCWKLVSHEFRTSDGKVTYPHGNDPAGLVIFMENGLFSGQIMYSGRSKFCLQFPTDEEIKAAYTSYIAYFGRFEVNEEDRILINHVDGALNNAWVGCDQTRHIEFSGEGHVTLSTEPMKIGNSETIGYFSWDKISH